ncbi:MAG: glycoside hydrolase family 3 protein [Acholeplasma sp.]|jgi:beta-glucosidase|nr:MAG: glycoside hydrolase family 3 protein [Acholeplasma sp.]
MKKILLVSMLFLLVLGITACQDQETPTNTTEITVTEEATNVLYLGDDAPDFTTWFEIDNSILGNVTVLDSMITTTLVIMDGKISQLGDFEVIITYIDSDFGTHSEVIDITVIEYVEPVDFTWDTYQTTGLVKTSIGASNMTMNSEMEGNYPILVVNVTRVTSTDWETLFGYEGFDFIAGYRYTFTITAKTNVASGREIGVAFERNDQTRMFQQKLSLTSEYQTFTGYAISDGDYDNGKFNIFLGDISASELGEVIFKEIKIVESFEIITQFDNPGSAVWTAPDLTDMESYVNTLLSTMTIEEKVGQMIQGERGSVSPSDIRDYNLGSVLNGGGSIPGDDIDDWFRMYVLYQLGAQESSAGIPIIFGTDSVHGNNNLLNATLFPHNIGLGAANDPELMRRIGEVVAIETRLTGISWTFAPAVSIAQDARWGRTYESLSENTALVSGLVASFIEGLQDAGVSGTAKHFVADGGTSGGIDQGNALLTDQQIRDIHLPPYQEAIDAGVDTIMISYSSIRGAKMHGSEYWIQTVLKDEMGFEGFIISDYDAIHQLPGSHYDQVVDSVNAGIDMLMEPNDWKAAYNDILAGYNNGDISESRIDDAVRRILTIKYKRGLFTEDIFRYQPELLADEAHLDVAREAVRKSLVLLQNNNNSLPLSKNQKIAIVGPGADDFGLMFGGWSLGWQGAVDPESGAQAGFAQYRKEARATTIYDGFAEALIGSTGSLVTDVSQADTVIVVLAETPYAEYHGDDQDLGITTGRRAHPGNAAAIQIAQNAQAAGKNVVGILLSGRPLLINNILQHFDAFVAAWLPGSEGGNGIADVFFGDYNFTGKTPFVWYYDSTKFGQNSNSVNYNPNDYLFPFGYGLTYDN